MKQLFRSIFRIHTLKGLGAALPVVISCYSLWFSVYSFRKQFELDMRPFVGISSVQSTRTDDETVITAVIKNTGKLPASIVELRSEWWVLRNGHATALAGAADTQKNLLVFPGAEMKYSVPLRGVLHQRYFKKAQSGYTLHILYELQYAAPQIKLSYEFGQKVTFESAGELSTIWVRGT